MAILPEETVPYKKQDSEHIKQIFTAWDQVKGEYLYESISALVMNEAQPKSPSRLNQTSYELLQSMDMNRIEPSPSNLSGVKGKYFQGVVTTESNLVGILDIQEVLKE